jgi:hypothetical protein
MRPKPKRIYFDTVAFRAVGKAFEKDILPADLKSSILISPITLFELWSQLTINKSGEILRQIQATTNWTDTKVGLLPWPDDALYALWHQTLAPDDGFTKKIEQAFNLSLAATSPDQLRDAAGGLRDAIDNVTDKMASEFKNLLDAARANGLESKDFSNAWYLGVAKRAKGDPSSKSLDEIRSSLNAYCEFEMSKLQVALENEDYNPKKHKNDVLDSEQLVYLYDASLNFLTCDAGFNNRVKKSTQCSQIFTTTQDKLSSATQVESLLRSILH